jgi:hypothetical protein
MKPWCIHTQSRRAATAAGIVLAAVAWLAPTTAARADGPGWTANSTVKKLVVTANGGVNVLLSPTVNNCVSQSGYGPNYISFYPDHPGLNRIKADLLAAYLTGGVVAIYRGPRGQVLSFNPYAPTA